MTERAGEKISSYGSSRGEKKSFRESEEKT